jgi:hypothetical protein
MKTRRLFNLSDKTTAHDRASAEAKMGSIERRKFLKAAAVGGVALSIEGAASLLAPNGARTQGAPTPAAPSWPNGRLLDLLKIGHPIIQAPMGGTVSPSMPVAVCGAGGLGSFPCSFFDCRAAARCGCQNPRPNWRQTPEPQLLL